MKIKLSLIFTGFLLLVQASTACDCKEYSLQQIIPNTEVIVAGKFISVEKNAWPLLPGQQESERLFLGGTIVITEVLQGQGFEVGDSISVLPDASNCASVYQNKREYLFFASRERTGIMADACSFTHKLIDRRQDQTYQEMIRIVTQ
ncbi:MAG: hypothetical protein AAF206_20510 [Bacteroidota bacterium]